MNPELTSESKLAIRNYMTKIVALPGIAILKRQFSEKTNKGKRIFKFIVSFVRLVCT